MCLSVWEILVVFGYMMVSQLFDFDERFDHHQSQIDWKVKVEVKVKFGYNLI